MSIVGIVLSSLFIRSICNLELGMNRLFMNVILQLKSCYLVLRNFDHTKLLWFDLKTQSSSCSFRHTYIMIKTLNILYKRANPSK